MQPLTDEQIRVLGAMIEKCHTTPDYYPMTVNAISTACNQKSNRDPVVSYDDRIVTAALAQLREQNLVFEVHTHDSRVVRYKQSLADELSLTPAEEALLSVLLLRGPQTGGELRGRSGRLHHFDSLPEVQSTLEQLARRELVACLPRPAGKKASPYTHLLGQISELEAPPTPPMPQTPPPDRIDQLAFEVDQLRQELAELRLTVQRMQPHSAPE